MGLIILALVMNLLRKPAATVGIMLAGGTTATDFFKAISGQGDKSTSGQTGSFNIGGNKFSLG
jgi:hypothetical protein